MSFSYLSILIFFAFSGAISIGLVLAPFIVSRITKTNKPYAEKLSPYECGFNPEGTEPVRFNIKFYLVGILFIIFDLEIAFLFPWAIALKHIGTFGFLSMMIFLFVVTVGLAYEFSMKALDW